MTKLRDIIEDIITEDSMDLTVREAIEYALRKNGAGGLTNDKWISCPERGCYTYEEIAPCGLVDKLDCKLRPNFRE